MAGESPAAILFNEAGTQAVGVVGDRLQVDAIVPGSTPPGDLSSLVVDYLKAGASSEMSVNGSGTPVDFVFNADPTNDIKVASVKLVIMTDDIKWEAGKFANDNVLTNGILWQVTAGGNTVEIANFKLTSDLLGVPFSETQYHLSGGKDWLTIDLRLNLAVILKAGTADRVRIQVRDNVTSNIKQTMYAKVAGVKI